MELNKEVYYSPEANQKYMSVSQFNDFMECEAMAMAKIRGEYVPPPNIFFLVGSYIHAWNDGTIEQFKLDHEEMFSSKGPTKGQLKSEFQFANRMIETLQNDQLCMFALNGNKEVIMTGELAGCQWKIRMDVHNTSGKRRIVDLKSTKSINDLVWSDERWAKVSFIDAYNYPRQFAVYGYIEMQNLQSDEWAEPYIVAVSKEDPPDKAVISLVDDIRFAKELDFIQVNMPHILAVKNGIEEPHRCDRCAYCRETKALKRVMHYSEIGIAV